MRIIKELCNGCGKCEVECHRNAIIKNQNGQFIIDESLCNECDGLLDIQCAWVCPLSCIVKTLQGTEYERIFSDSMIRLRPDHLLYLIAIMGSANSGRYVNGREWAPLRKIIAKAFLDPELEVRVVPTFDDACVGCKLKKDPNHVKQLIWEDKKTLDKVGFKFGKVVKFWDAVTVMKKKIDVKHLKSIKKPKSFIEDFLNSPSLL